MWARLAHTGRDGARFRTEHAPLPMNALSSRPIANRKLRTSEDGPRCIKLFARVFYGKNQETPAKKNVSIAICIEICQSFFYGKKKSGKKFYALGPREERCRSHIQKSPSPFNCYYSYRTYSQRNASLKFVWGHWNPMNIALQFKWRDN